MISVICTFCKISYYVKNKVFKDKTRHDPNHSFFCSKKCLSQFNTTGTWQNCITCGILIYRTKSLIEKFEFAYCSHKCAAITNNLKRTSTTKGKTKNYNCITCDCEIEASIHVNSITIRCNGCFFATKPKIKKSQI